MNNAVFTNYSTVTNDRILILYNRRKRTIKLENRRKTAYEKQDKISQCAHVKTAKWPKYCLEFQVCSFAFLILFDRCL